MNKWTACHTCTRFWPKSTPEEHQTGVCKGCLKKAADEKKQVVKTYMTTPRFA